MTHITITPNTEKKRIRVSGDAIAAGEHVSVTVVGFADMIGEGSRLRLRVMLDDRTVAVFPRTSEESWIPENEGDIACELNLNTIPLHRITRCGGCEFVVVLDDVGVPQKYCSGDIFIGAWRQEPGADVPYDLDRYPDIIREFHGQLDAFGEDVEAAKSAAQSAQASSAQAASSAASANVSATTALNQVAAAQSAASAAQASAVQALDAVEEVQGSVEAAQTAASNAEASASAASESAESAAQSASEAVGAVEEKADKDDLDAHVEDMTNPHGVTKAQVGLGNVDNTSDADKPVSEAQQAAIDVEKSRALSAEIALANEVNLLSDAFSSFKSKFDFSTISELAEADSARAIKNAFNNLLQKLKAVNQ